VPRRCVSKFGKGHSHPFPAQVRARVRGRQSTNLNLRIVIESLALPSIVPASLPPVYLRVAEDRNGAGIEESYMFISPAFAQATGGGTGGGFEAMLPLILIFVVFYFLLIRPQQKKAKQHRETLSAIRRGDKVVTGGGILGNVTKVDNDHEVTVEIAKDVKVKVRRDLISAVVSKTEPQAATPQAANEDKPRGGMLQTLLGFGAKRPDEKIKEKSANKTKATVKAEKGNDKPEKTQAK